MVTRHSSSTTSLYLILTHFIWQLTSFLVCTRWSTYLPTSLGDQVLTSLGLVICCTRYCFEFKTVDCKPTSFASKQCQPNSNFKAWGVPSVVGKNHDETNTKVIYLFVCWKKTSVLGRKIIRSRLISGLEGSILPSFLTVDKLMAVAVSFSFNWSIHCSRCNGYTTSRATSLIMQCSVEKMIYLLKSNFVFLLFGPFAASFFIYFRLLNSVYYFVKQLTIKGLESGSSGFESKGFCNTTIWIN